MTFLEFYTCLGKKKKAKPFSTVFLLDDSEYTNLCQHIYKETVSNKTKLKIASKTLRKKEGASGGKGGRNGEKETERDWGWGVNKFLLSENSHPW